MKNTHLFMAISVLAIVGIASGACDNSSYTDCATAYNMTSGMVKGPMCGGNQYYTINTDFACDITWNVTPSLLGDYKLYVGWGGLCPTTSTYNCSSNKGVGTPNSCSRAGAPSGMQYAMVYHNNLFGEYNLSVSVANCLVCNSTAYTTPETAYTMTANQTKGPMCGSQYQYYKINVTSDVCDLKWNATSMNNGDYDLYVKWNGSVPTTTTYDGKSANGINKSDSLSRSITNGTYYALVDNYQHEGRYNISAELTNCRNITCDKNNYTSPETAYQMTNGTAKTGMCGTTQYYKINVTNELCDLQWDMTPYNGDYDLFVKWNGSAATSPYTDVDCPEEYHIDGTNTSEKCPGATGTRTVSNGTYYATVRMWDAYPTGNYSISVNVSNCRNRTCDYTNFTSPENASWINKNETKTGMCGNQYQYYKINVTNSYCDITWNMTPSGNGDYDLLANWDGSVPFEAPRYDIDCPEDNFVFRGNATEICPKTGTRTVLNGTYYAMVARYDTLPTSNYSISVNLNNCMDCDSAACTTPETAYTMTSGQTKTSMCGSQYQYYKINVTSDICDLKWNATSMDNGDYDLYVKWNGSVPTTTTYDGKSANGINKSDSLSRSVSKGTYYALVDNYQHEGRYNISANLENCGNYVVISVEPVTLEAGINNTFVINISATKVDNASAVEFSLHVNPQILEITAAIDEGDFLNNDGGATYQLGPFLDRGAGNLTFSVSRGAGAVSNPTSRGVAYVTLKSITNGTSDLQITSTKMLNSNGDEIPTRGVNGSVTVRTWITQGDIDGDGCVNLFDLSLMGRTYGTCAGSNKYNPAADFNNDGCIGLADFWRLAQHYALGVVCPP